jgi:hypothetical protein
MQRLAPYAAARVVAPVRLIRWARCCSFLFVAVCGGTLVFAQELVRFDWACAASALCDAKLLFGSAKCRRQLCVFALLYFSFSMPKHYSFFYEGAR